MIAMATDDDGCPFCYRVFANEFTYSWPDVVAFAPLNPVVPGHVLVVPRMHVPDAAADPEVTAATMRRASQIMRGFGGDWNVITSVGAAATQTVFHLHVHLVPRRDGDGLALPWTGQHQREGR